MGPPRRPGRGAEGSPARGRTRTGAATAARGRPRASDRCTVLHRNEPALSELQHGRPWRASRAMMRSAGSVDASSAGPPSITVAGSSPIASGARRAGCARSARAGSRGVLADAEVQHQHRLDARVGAVKPSARRATRRAASRRSPRAGRTRARFSVSSEDQHGRRILRPPGRGRSRSAQWSARCANARSIRLLKPGCPQGHDLVHGQRRQQTPCRTSASRLGRRSATADSSRRSP